MTIKYHFCSFYQTPDGLSYCDGIVFVINPIDSYDGYSALKENIIKVFNLPITTDKLVVSSLSRLV